MGIFNRRPREDRATTLSALRKIIERSGATFAGIPVDAAKALESSTFWACQELVASVGSSLPLDEYKTVAGKLVGVPLSPLFADPDPDPSITAVGSRAQLLRSVIAHGNAYADLFDASRGAPQGMSTISPNRVVWRYEKTGDVSQWQVYVDNKRRERWPLGDLWHFPLFQQPGSPIGLNPVEYHKQSIGAQLAAQKFGAQFFEAGGHPTITIKMPDDPGLEESKKIAARVKDMTSGSRDPMVIPGGWSVDTMSTEKDDAQFLETQRYGVEEIARIVLGGFPELVGGSVGGDSVTYANREQRMADFIALSLSPRYLIPLEAALSALLPAGRIVKHNVNALLRSDLQARYASYKTAAEVADLMGTPLLTVDEMRDFEDLPSLGGEFVRRPTKTAKEPRAVIPPAETHVHLGDTNVAAASPANVTVRNEIPAVEPPIVNVTNDVRAAEGLAPIVNVTNDVTVPEPTVTVVQHAEQKQTVTRKVKRDKQGRITELTDEVS